MVSGVDGSAFDRFYMNQVLLWHLETVMAKYSPTSPAFVACFFLVT